MGIVKGTTSRCSGIEQKTLLVTDVEGVIISRLTAKNPMFLGRKLKKFRRTTLSVNTPNSMSPASTAGKRAITLIFVNRDKIS
jgi:hypothetical protein